MLMFIFFTVGLVISGLVFNGSWMYYYGLIMTSCFLFGLKFYTEGGMFWLLGNSMGVDIMSFCLIYLSFWISGLMVLASFKVYFSFNNTKEFSLMVIFLLLMLMMTFSVLDYLWFYIFFEGSLIPTLLLILGWGYQPDRLQAGLYMLFYTLFGSLPLLVSIAYLFECYGSITYFLMWNASEVYVFWYLASVVGFFVKMPMYLVHLWLPKAHVEAPISGSMVLAGVLLKLGGYGLFRILKLFVIMNMKINVIWMSISLVGGFVVSLSCLRQNDLKCLIAYSSVVHMGLVLAGLMTMNTWGFQGALTLMIGHGLCSSGLFSLANISYERVSSRAIMMNSGLISLFPSMSFWWFMLSISNMAAPPSLNLFGEVTLMMSLLGWLIDVFLVVALVSFFSAVYTLYLYSITQHGVPLVGYQMDDCKSREYMISFLHWLPLNMLVLKGDLIFSWV